jgi:hypothetical protein
VCVFVKEKVRLCVGVCGCKRERERMGAFDSVCVCVFVKEKFCLCV